MPLETLTGPDIASLLERARHRLGGDAVLVSLAPRRDGAEPAYELVAADPETARLWAAAAPSRHPAPRRAAPAPAPSRGAGGGRAVLALVGPTGAGKTTTVAKLANHPEAFAGRSVGLVCLDTYRVGAVEQLGVYAELSGLPLEVVYEASDIPGALRRLRGCDVLLVDTAGRGPRGRTDAETTADQLARLAPDEVHLALPAGLRPVHARRVAGEHALYGVTHVLPTKLDEDPEDRVAIALARELGLGVRWVAEGQEVPRDLRAVPGADDGPGIAELARTARASRLAAGVA